MVGNVCAISGDQPASLATDIDLWRCSQKRHQQACERRSADAKRAGKEWRAGVLKVAEPSGYLRRAMGRPLTGAGEAEVHCFGTHSASELLDGVRGRTRKSADLLHDELHSLDTSSDST